MADERSVDVDEPRDPQPDPGSRPRLIARDAGHLSPVQQAHGYYNAHFRQCPQCQDIDHERCEDGKRLWRAWSTACDQAYRRLADETG